MILDITDALSSSLDISTALERAFPTLLRLVPADYAALGVSPTGRAEDYAWVVTQLPPSFFAAYPEMAPHDFVRDAVAAQPNRVLRDEEMIPRTALEANMMYHRARETGARLEQVMAVMLHVDARWQGGLALYRDRRRPFSEREQAVLQRLVPTLANTVRNCHLHGAAVARGDALDHLTSAHGLAEIVLDERGVEVARSDAAGRLLDAWFAPVERRLGGLPDPLRDLVAQAVAEGTAPARPWRRHAGDVELEVTCATLPAQASRGRFMLSLRAIPTPKVPARWADRLTCRQLEIASLVLRGWDNQLVADVARCTVGTVKKHLQGIFDRLGVPSRAALIALALTEELGLTEERAGS